MADNKTLNGEKKQKNIKEWFNRLKETVGVHSDSDLAKSLKISQQAIAGSKNNDVLPGSWIKKLSRKNLSIDYIIYGGEQKNGAEEFNISETKTQENIVEGWVRMVLQKRGFSIDEMQVAVLVSVAKKNILPMAENELVDLILDFSGLDRIEENKNTDQ